MGCDFVLFGIFIVAAIGGIGIWSLIKCEYR